jgi:hypothetical protein
MTDVRLTLRRIIACVACGLVGAVAGGLGADAAARYFAGSPAWELPAISVGVLAVVVVGVLGMASASGVRRRTRK